MSSWPCPPATHQGTRELVQAIARRLAELPPVTVYEPEYVPRPPEVDTTAPLDIHRDDHTWLVEGPWLQRLMGNINFPTMRAGCTSIRFCASRVCSISWSRWGSRTGISSPCTI